jgi:RIO kinase 1
MGHRERLSALLDIGVVDEIVRPLMSGKEAEVFLVVSQGERRVAKLYKEATSRSFKHRAEYTEGRRTKNTRQQRAMSRRSKYGREQEEMAWKSAEVDAIYRLRAAGVRVPEPYDFVDGILIMELIAGIDGEPAPRLVDVTLTRDQAEQTHKQLIREITRMLCAGLVHGDLSDFNVLMTPTGPVVIDFPQAVDAAMNNNARRMLLRDVRNVTGFLARFSPRLRKTQYGEEMWALYEQGKLQPDTELTGRFEKSKKGVDLMGILDEIYAAEVEERRRRDALGLEQLPDKRPPPPRKGRGPLRDNDPRLRKGKGNETGGAPGSDAGGKQRRRRGGGRPDDGPPAPGQSRRGPRSDRADARPPRKRRRHPESAGAEQEGGARPPRPSGGPPRRREVVLNPQGGGGGGGSGAPKKRRRRRRRGRRGAGEGGGDRS